MYTNREWLLVDYRFTLSCLEHYMRFKMCNVWNLFQRMVQDKPGSTVVTGAWVVNWQPSWSNVILLQACPTMEEGLAQGCVSILSMLVGSSWNKVSMKKYDNRLFYTLLTNTASFPYFAIISWIIRGVKYTFQSKAFYT